MTVYRALVVGRDEGWTERWVGKLQREGFQTFTCAGASDALQCPRLSGARCIRREMVDVAVVNEVDDEHRVCTRLRDDGTTVHVPNSTDPRSGDGPCHQSQASGEVLRAVWEAARGRKDR
jgi:hypothetical protein